MSVETKKKICGAFRSRTMWFSFFVAMLGAATAAFPILRDVIDADVYAVTMFFLSFVYGSLRATTTKPLEER